MFKCPKCSKVYKNNGKWIKKHMIEECHVMHLEPVELVEKEDIGLHEILTRINNLESMIKNNRFTTKYIDDPIERIKQEEAKKLTDPLLREFRGAFTECIAELKEVLKIRKEQLEELEFKEVFIEEDN